MYSSAQETMQLQRPFAPDAPSLCVQGLKKPVRWRQTRRSRSKRVYVIGVVVEHALS